MPPLRGNCGRWGCWQVRQHGDEVIAWAEATAAGRTFVLYACVPHDGLGLVRLMGTDPNET